MWNDQINENILYEDKEILVCRKPSGMPVQAARIGTMDLESAIKNYLAQKAPGKMPYLAVVHRLDQPVEGVLVFAKTPGAAGNLSKQMMGRRRRKILSGSNRRSTERPGRNPYQLSEKKRKSEHVPGSTGKYTWCKKGNSPL